MSITLINGYSTVNNGPKSLPRNPPRNPAIWDSWAFDNFILVDELFAKFLKDLET